MSEIYEVFYNVKTFKMGRINILKITQETELTYRGDVLTDKMAPTTHRFVVKKSMIGETSQLWSRIPLLRVWVFADSIDDAVTKAKTMFADFLAQKVEELRV